MKRRDFLKASAAFGSAMILPSAATARVKGANSRAKIAVIGWGGQGKSSVNSIVNSPDADLVALCDVDEGHAAACYRDDRSKGLMDKIRGLPQFKDYRVMLDKMDRDIDGVCVCTPDHSHYPICAWAIAKKKHVFCEKPLTRTIWESRELKRLAEEAGVYTQMGNQVHTNDAWRTIREWFESGIMGEVEDVYAWTDRSWGFDSMPKETPKPATLDYDLWLNVAHPRPFSGRVVPFNWRGLRDFGTGSAGDMGCHFLDNPYSAFGLGAPFKLVSDALPAKDFSWPKAATIDMFFKNRFGRDGVVKIHWFDGLRRPKEIRGVDPEFLKDPKNMNCIFIVGTKNTMTFEYTGSGVRLTDRGAQIGLAKAGKIPPKKLERNRFPFNPQADWASAIVEERMPESNFSYAAPFTEVVLLSMVSCINPGVELEYDEKAMRFPNFPEADRYVRSLYSYRPEFLPRALG